MKKFNLVLLSLLALCLLASSAFAAVELKLSHSGPTIAEGDKNDEGCKAFKEYVERESNGEIVVNIFPNNQLGNEREQLEGVLMGTIEAASITTGTVPTVYNDILVFDIPYLFPSYKVAHKVLDGAFGQKIADGFHKSTGSYILGFGENGYRHFTNRVREIRSPEDVKGLKIRTMENPIHIAMMKSLGAVPTPIPFGELYTAMSQGVVDGQENPVSLIESCRFYEVQKYLSLDGHFYSPFVLLFNQAAFEGLSKEHQAIIREGANAWKQRQRQFNFDVQRARALESIKKHGTQVAELTPAELLAFREATQKEVLPLIEEEVGQALAAEALAAVSAAEK